MTSTSIGILARIKIRPQLRHGLRHPFGGEELMQIEKRERSGGGSGLKKGAAVGSRGVARAME
jgi:hypothetical protein